MTTPLDGHVSVRKADSQKDFSRNVTLRGNGLTLQPRKHADTRAPQEDKSPLKAAVGGYLRTTTSNRSISIVGGRLDSEYTDFEEGIKYAKAYLGVGFGRHNGT